MGFEDGSIISKSFNAASRLVFLDIEGQPLRLDTHISRVPGLNQNAPTPAASRLVFLDVEGHPLRLDTHISRVPGLTRR